MFPFPGNQKPATRSLLKGLFKKVVFGAGFHGLFAGFDFMEGLEKSREGFRMGLQKSAGVNLKNILAGAGLASLGVGLAFEMGRYLQKRKLLASTREQAMQAFEQAVAGDPHLQQYPREQLLQYLQAILEIAPNVASNPVLLRQLLKQVATYGGIDPQSAKVLAEVDAHIFNRKAMGLIEAGEVTKAITGASGLLGNYAGLLGG